MIKVVNRRSDKKYSTFVYVTLFIMFIVAPLYSQPNLGGAGLDLPFNIPIWAVFSWLVAGALFLLVQKREFIYPRVWPFFIIFPVFIIISSLYQDISQPIEWLIRLLYILGGLAFFFALFQFDVKNSLIDKVLFLFVIAGGLHALIAVFQVFSPESLPTWMPYRKHIPIGMFQQVNVLASFLVSTTIIAIYIISRPIYSKLSLVNKILLVVAYAISLYIVFLSGSRVGLLALLITIPLILIARRTQLFRHKYTLALLLLLTCVSFLAGQSGVEKSIDKAAQLTEKSYSVARVAMYSIGAELVIQKPMGHGIGGFLKAWNQQASDFVSRHPETYLPNYVRHPHNEVLFWMIEGGVPAIIGIVAVMIGIIIGLYNTGFARGSAYMAMLIPISLHTQVEHPFYISSLHWFLWLFLIYMICRHQTKTVAINMSVAASRLIQWLSLVFAITLTIFMINTARAQSDLYNFITGKKSESPYLKIALNNLFTQNSAEQIAMRSMLYQSIETNDREQVIRFMKWAKSYINMSPELKMYEDLISASDYLNPEGNGCDMIDEALKMYAHNQPLQSALNNCDR